MAMTDHRALVALVAGLMLALPPRAQAKSAEAPVFAPSLPITQPAPAAASGSIFAAGYAPLHTGLRARLQGDPVTIRLVETTTAAKSVSAKSAKGGEASITPPSAGLLSFLNPDALKMGSNSSFNGQGNAGQTSTLNATLSVTIAEVRANGTALLRGEKRMHLSQGDEWVRFSGIVRLADIDEDNTVASSRVADAHIEYSGRGALQRASRPGWLSRFFNAVSPF